MAESENPEEAQVTFEDQKKINLFARKNVTLTELRVEIEEIKKNLQNIEDASDDLMLLEDEEENIGYQIGEVFIDHSLEVTQGMLEKTKNELEDKVNELENECGDIKQVMNDLKVQLYAKFGDTINLEQ